MIEKAALNVDQLLKKLNKALAAEITTYYYTVLKNHVVGEDLKEITEDPRLEDRLHFEALVPRVYELGGDIYRDMKDLHDDAACPAAYLPKGITVNTVHNDATNERILKVLLDAERCAVRVYTDICKMTFGEALRPLLPSFSICTESTYLLKSYRRT